MEKIPILCDPFSENSLALNQSKAFAHRKDEKNYPCEEIKIRPTESKEGKELSLAAFTFV